MSKILLGKKLPMKTDHKKNIVRVRIMKIGDQTENKHWFI